MLIFKFHLALLTLVISSLSVNEILACEDLLDVLIFSESKAPPYCVGDTVDMVVRGVYLGGGISSNVNEDLSISTSLQYKQYGDAGLQIIFDGTENNFITFTYDFEVIENQYEEGRSCSIEKTFNFEVGARVSLDNPLITWNEGDLLALETQQDNLCYQWGEVIDNVEIDITGENDSSFKAPASPSPFIESISGISVSPKEEFDNDYYLRLSLCDDPEFQCLSPNIIYFTPENFVANPLSPEEGDKPVIYPNPGNGQFSYSITSASSDKTTALISITSPNGASVPFQIAGSSINNYQSIDINSEVGGLYILTFRYGHADAEDSIVFSKLYLKNR